MNTEMQTKIREWEAERDRNLRIHCPLVAANSKDGLTGQRKKTIYRISSPVARFSTRKPVVDTFMQENSLYGFKIDCIK